MPARHEFASDNTAPICSEVWDAIEKANRGAAASYGEDEWTAQLCERVRDLFETDCQVFLVFNGTAANALALAQLCRPFHSVICHERAHIETDECGAPEFFSGSKLLLVRGNRGKIDIGEAKSVISRQPELHAQKPRVITGKVRDGESLGGVLRREKLRPDDTDATLRALGPVMDFRKEIQSGQKYSIQLDDAGRLTKLELLKAFNFAGFPLARTRQCTPSS